MEFNYDQACAILGLEKYHLDKWVSFKKLPQILIETIDATKKRDKNSTIPVKRATILLETIYCIEKHC